VVFQGWVCCADGIEGLWLCAVHPWYHCTIFSGVVARLRVHIQGWVSPDSCTAGQSFSSSDSQKTYGWFQRCNPPLMLPALCGLWMLVCCPSPPQDPCLLHWDLQILMAFISVTSHVHLRILAGIIEKDKHYQPNNGHLYTPLLPCTLCDWVPLMTTFCSLTVKKSFSHLRTLPPMLKVCIFARRRRCGAESNAIW